MVVLDHCCLWAADSGIDGGSGMSWVWVGDVSRHRVISKSHCVERETDGHNQKTRGGANERGNRSTDIPAELARISGGRGVAMKLAEKRQSRAVQSNIMLDGPGSRRERLLEGRSCQNSSHNVVGWNIERSPSCRRVTI